MEKNKTLTELLPKDVQDAGFQVIGISNFSKMKRGIVQGHEIDFENISVARAEQIASRLKKQYDADLKSLEEFKKNGTKTNVTEANIRIPFLMKLPVSDKKAVATKRAS